MFVTAVAMLVILGIAIPHKTSGDKDETLHIQLNPIESLSETPTIEEVKVALVFASKEYGLDESQLLRVASCESGFKYTAIGKAGEIGILQFMPSTWVYWNKERRTELNINSTQDQINMVVWAWQNNLQHNWTCFSKYY